MSASKVLAFVLLVGAAALVWQARPAPLPAPSEQPVAAPSPQQLSLRLREGSIVLRHKGLKQAEIQARRVTVSADLSSAQFTDITHARIYDAGDVALDVSAREIVMDRRTNDLQIHGPVIVTSPLGYRLTAPEARWHHALQQVIFPSGVHISLRNEEITAGSLVLDSGMRTFALSSGVDITFRFEEARR